VQRGICLGSFSTKNSRGPKALSGRAFSLLCITDVAVQGPEGGLDFPSTVCTASYHWGGDPAGRLVRNGKASSPAACRSCRPVSFTVDFGVAEGVHASRNLGISIGASWRVIGGVRLRETQLGLLALTLGVETRSASAPAPNRPVSRRSQRIREHLSRFAGTALQ
jgi:hypothetical protein